MGGKYNSMHFYCNVCIIINCPIIVVIKLRFTFIGQPIRKLKL